jgi:hypothetical protein
MMATQANSSATICGRAMIYSPSDACTCWKATAMMDRQGRRYRAKEVWTPSKLYVSFGETAGRRQVRSVTAAAQARLSAGAATQPTSPSTSAPT